MKLMKGAGWIGVGVTIADMIAQGLRDGQGGMRDALADGLDPGKVLNPDYWLEKIFGNPTPGVLGGGVDNLPGNVGVPNGGVMGSDGKPYQPVQPGTPGAVPIPGRNEWGTPGSLGSAPSGGREPDRPIPVYPDGGLPVPIPNPGGGSTPNIPYDRYSLDSIALGQFPGSQWATPDPRSMVSQLTPNQINQGKTNHPSPTQPTPYPPNYADRHARKSRGPPP